MKTAAKININQTLLKYVTPRSKIGLIKRLAGSISPKEAKKWIAEVRKMRASWR
ncbi:MAG: hypothetical protein US50_C0001G0016 [Candidatus Nomurabacteria bacterium GW2011_GWB1_37_5]|uniref:Uncharacterized protein n=1 Tax=Candidatus Nomurabacteria bacterium GW2011_GWB1_37_5 TaxID=1618742 RepID=A0A0G0JGY3_9BACT|nr:MAG: hypothetical protein US50_C0001G0016 [Candidatus Nomurabacteria bacterium GW2011_GWB1_37_5]